MRQTLEKHSFKFKHDAKFLKKKTKKNNNNIYISEL